MFGGSMAGTLLMHLPKNISIAGLQFKVSSAFLYLLLISGIIRLISGVFFLPIVRELREVQSFSLSEWAFQITGLRPQEGTRYSPVAEKSDAANEPDDPAELVDEPKRLVESKRL
jgi:hypothetical protein